MKKGERIFKDPRIVAFFVLRLFSSRVFYVPRSSFAGREASDNKAITMI